MQACGSEAAIIDPRERIHATLQLPTRPKRGPDARFQKKCAFYAGKIFSIEILSLNLQSETPYVLLSARADGIRQWPLTRRAGMFQDQKAEY